jgi:cysteine desulfurase
VEHEAVLRLAGGAARLPVDACGLVAPAACALSGLVAVQQANNETGVMQPMEAIAEAVRGAGGILLCDAAQGAGKLALPDADLIALSAHKFGGPVGIGALLVRDWAMLRPTGGQERGYRAGTENLPGALAMAAALEEGAGWLDEAVRLRDLLDGALTQAGGAAIAAETARVPSIAAYRMPGRSAQAQLIRLDAMGFAVSAGSACSSGSLKASHVLTAMAVEGAGEVIRVSLGRETSEADVMQFIDAWKQVAGKS